MIELRGYEEFKKRIIELDKKEMRAHVKFLLHLAAIAELCKKNDYDFADILIKSVDRMENPPEILKEMINDRKF